MTERHSLKLELVSPTGRLTLTEIDIENPDEHGIFTAIRDNIAGARADYVGKPESMSYFQATDMKTGNKYDLAMLFTTQYLEKATAGNLQTDYQMVTRGLVKLCDKIREGEL